MRRSGDNRGPFGDWERLTPEDAAELLAGFDAPWWIAGGWALDPFLGTETRQHDDVDVAVLRRDQLDLYQHFRGWDLRYATADRALVPWDGRALSLQVHGVWARRSHDPNAPWTFEVLLDEHGVNRWVYRRNPAISCALVEVGGLRRGIPFLRPEVVLLYKSKDPTPKDENDFDAVRPHLSEHGRSWLRRALELTAPGHRWLERLTER
jgi:hypothetical protein